MPQPDQGAIPASYGRRRTLIIALAAAVLLAGCGVAAAIATQSEPDAASEALSASQAGTSPAAAPSETASPSASASVTDKRRPLTSPEARPSASPRSGRAKRPVPPPSRSAQPGWTPAPAAMPQGDLPGWRQVLAQDFTHWGEVPVDPKAGFWNATGIFNGRNGHFDTSGHGYFNEFEVVGIHRRALSFWLHTESSLHYVAAAIPHYFPPPKQYATIESQYGKYSVRFRADAVPGYQLSFGLYDRAARAKPRILFPTGALDGTIRVGRVDSTGGAARTLVRTNAKFTDWHVATIEWTPDRIVFFLDGQRIGSTTSRVPREKMMWSLEAETLASGPEPKDSAAGRVLVDWIVQYQRK